MGRTACTESQCLYSRAITLLPLCAVGLYRASVPLQGCTLPFLPVYILHYGLLRSHALSIVLHSEQNSNFLNLDIYPPTDTRGRRHLLLSATVQPVPLTDLGAYLYWTTFRAYTLRLYFPFINQASTTTELRQELYLTDVSCSEIENGYFSFTQLTTLLPQISSKDGEYPVSWGRVLCLLVRVLWV